MRPRFPFQRIDCAIAEALIGREDVLVLDVRDAASFRAGSMGEAHNVSFASLSPIIDGAPRDMPILIYCYHGLASQEYAQIFSDFGFREVYSLDGGYEAWSMRSRPVSSGRTS